MSRSIRVPKIKSGSTPDEVALRIRELRIAKGLSFGKLAALAGLRSASHVFHVENGHKIPSEAVAVRLATALGDDPELYRAWARARNRGDLEAMLVAAAELSRRLLHLGVRDPSPPTMAVTHAPFLSSEVAALSPTDAPMLLRVPVIEEGVDPGDGLVPQAPVLETLHLDPSWFAMPERLRRPFAYAKSPPAGAALQRPEHYRIVSREFAALLESRREPEPRSSVFAIRRRGRVVVAPASWDGQALQWLDETGAPGTIEVAGMERLRESVIGTVVMEILRR